MCDPSGQVDSPGPMRMQLPELTATWRVSTKPQYQTKEGANIQAKMLQTTGELQIINYQISGKLNFSTKLLLI